MSLKGVIEVILRLESYHIIEYPHQGLFSFHCILYQQVGSTRRYAIPYQLLPRNTQEKNPRIILEPRIDDQIAISSTGLAKYSDQVVTLQDWVQLRLEVQAYPELSAESVYLQIQLRFNKTKLSEPQSQGQLLETITIRLNDLENGIFSYFEAEFTSPYLSRLRLSLLTFLSSFRFAKYDGLKDTTATKERANITSLEELLKYAQRELLTETPEKLFYSSYVKKLRISQYLFADKVTQLSKEVQSTLIKLPQDYLQAHKIEKPIERDLKQYLDHYFPEPINLARLLQQLNSIRQQNFDSLQELISLWRSDMLKENQLKEEFQLYEKEKYGQRVFRSIVQSGIEQGQREKIGYRENKKIAKEIRGKNLILNSYSLEDIRDQQSREEQELVFYQVSLPSETLPDLQPSQMKIAEQGRRFQYSQKHMLVVLCHGFQGSSQDMLLVKRWIQNQLPEAYYLIARCNEDDTEGDIRAMGKRLAEEIEKFINNYMEQYEGQNVIINLVGHSMGGIIARAALPHLQRYQSQMGFFCSLGSPHLGYLNGVSGLVKVGLWAIRKWKKVQSLEQLSMEERGDPRKTFLYELSKVGHLKHFRKVILLCSFQDSYVPWHSARISGHRAKNSLTKVEQEMIENILGLNVYGVGVHRLDVNFNVKTNNLDSFIGRTAHINLIVRDNLFKMLGTTLPKLFDLTEHGRQNIFL